MPTQRQSEAAQLSYIFQSTCKTAPTAANEGPTLDSFPCSDMLAEGSQLDLLMFLSCTTSVYTKMMVR